MDYEQRVRRASGGDVKAFVDLTRQFKHMAFGAALALVNDFHQAEDVVQEAFVAAWSSLPGLADPAAFPSWLRSIVRHQAFRVLRKRTLRTVPLAEAEDLPGEELPADRRVEQRRQSAMALAAIAGLPDKLREPATLFFIHECSHQDIAVFLGLPVATVNNRLHAARSKLKERMLVMVNDTFQAHALPDDFANRIGRLIEARGAFVEALFNPDAPPDVLTELAVSDEANRRAVAVQVFQRPSGGFVRGIALSPAAALPRGSTVLSSGNQSETPVNLHELGRILPQLAGPSPITTGAARLLVTGIKVIDVMCPLVAGGNAIIAGELCNPTYTLYELTHRLKDGPDGPQTVRAVAGVARRAARVFVSGFVEGGGVGGYSVRRGTAVLYARRGRTVDREPVVPPGPIRCGHSPLARPRPRPRLSRRGRRDVPFAPVADKRRQC